MDETENITKVLPPAPAANTEEKATDAAPREAGVEVPDEIWEEVGELACLLVVDLPLQRLTVRDLLRLGVGEVLASRTAGLDAVPVIVNRQTIGWAVLEIVGENLAVRMTELV